MAKEGLIKINRVSLLILALMAISLHFKIGLLFKEEPARENKASKKAMAEKARPGTRRSQRLDEVKFRRAPVVKRKMPSYDEVSRRSSARKRLEDFRTKLHDDVEDEVLEEEEIFLERPTKQVVHGKLFKVQKTGKKASNNSELDEFDVNVESFDEHSDEEQQGGEEI